MKDKIIDWIVALTIPREELLGFSICPYAKQAYQSGVYDIIESDVEDIHNAIQQVDLITNQVVVVIVKNYDIHSIELMRENTLLLNEMYNPSDIVVLDNDPREPFIVNGVTTTFPGSYLWVLQSLSDLNAKHVMLSKTNYYSVWTNKQLEEVVTWRKQK